MLEGCAHKSWVTDLLHFHNHGIKAIQKLTFWKLWFLSPTTGESGGKYPHLRKSQRFVFEQLLKVTRRNMGIEAMG